MDFQQSRHDCYQAAPPIRDLLREVGDGIFLRGSIEFSSDCRNQCAYCGLKGDDKTLVRYRLTPEQIPSPVDQVIDNRIRTILLQSGVEDTLGAHWFAAILRSIKAKYDVVMTLARGEQSDEESKRWWRVVANRYLLKIESSDAIYYQSYHSGMNWHQRDTCLSDLGSLGYQVGSGFSVGLRGQTLDTLAGDLLYFQNRQFDRIGIGPFIPRRETLRKKDGRGTVLDTVKMVAPARVAARNARLPATTTLGSFEGGDRKIRALTAGANVLMPNFVQQPYRRLFEKYPIKRSVDETVAVCRFYAQRMAKRIGRYVDYVKSHLRRLTVSHYGQRP